MYLCAVNNTLPIIMPRQERLQSATGIYHVMLRGINKQDMALFTEQKVDHENRPQISAEDTHSTVIAPQHKLPAGYKYDGSNFLNILGKSYIPTYSPAQYYLSHGNTSKTVTNVTIDKSNGLKWDGFMPTSNF